MAKRNQARPVNARAPVIGPFLSPTRYRTDSLFAGYALVAIWRMNEARVSEVALNWMWPAPQLFQMD